MPNMESIERIAASVPDAARAETARPSAHPATWGRIIAIRVAVAGAALFYGGEVVRFYADAELLPLHIAAFGALVTLWIWARRPPRGVTLGGALLAVIFASLVAAGLFNVWGAEERMGAELLESGRARTACDQRISYCSHFRGCAGNTVRTLEEGAAAGRREDADALLSIVRAREPGYGRAALALLRRAQRHADADRLEQAGRGAELPSFSPTLRHIDRQRWWTPTTLERFGVMKDYVRGERLSVRAAEEARELVLRDVRSRA